MISSSNLTIRLMKGVNDMQEKSIVATDRENKSHNDIPAVFRLMNEEIPPKEVFLPFHFDESYFTKPDGSKKHNEQLATMSCILAYSAFSHFREGEKRYLNQDADLRYLLTGEAGGGKYEYPDYKGYETTTLGFRWYRENKFYHTKATEDSIAFSFATRIIASTKSPIICVAIRGGGYEFEWSSNFNIGDLQEGKYHKGFYVASNQVITDLSEYVEMIKRTSKMPIKLWIVGYSRGGAVANITAHRIKTGRWMKDWGIASDDIYTYTFEAPAGIYSESEKVSGIYNRINYIDPIPRFVFKQWKFSRAGDDIMFPKVGDSDFDENFKKVYSYMWKYLHQNPETYSSVSKSNLFITVLDDFVTRIIKNMESWRDFQNHQEPLSAITAWFMSLSPEETKLLYSKYFKVATILMNLLASDRKTAEDNFKTLFHEVCPTRSEKECTELTSCVLKLEEFLKIIVKDANLLELINLAIIFLGVPWTHSPMLCLSWLMSQDGKYNANLDGIDIEAIEASLIAQQLPSLFAELESCDDRSAQEEIIINWLSRHS